MFSNQSRPLATFGSCAGFAILTFTAAGAQEPLFRQLPADVQLSARQAALVEFCQDLWRRYWHQSHDR